MMLSAFARAKGRAQQRRDRRDSGSRSERTVERLKANWN